MAYIRPETVDSPRAQWKLLRVLWSTEDDGASLALGIWDGEPALAMRWNGKSRAPGVGNPQSRGLPTWFILPEEFHEAILSSGKLAADKEAVARNLFELHSGSAAH